MSANPLVGARRLILAEARTASGEIHYPFGRDAAGYLIYSEDGYMSGSIMEAKRVKFTSADLGAGSPEERLTAFDSYLSCCGRHEVAGNKVVHHIELRLFPNWSGADQERWFELAGNRLTLTMAPVVAGGVEQTARVIWERATPRAGAV